MHFFCINTLLFYWKSANFTTNCRYMNFPCKRYFLNVRPFCIIMLYSTENLQNSQLTVKTWTLIMGDIFKRMIFAQICYYFVENQQSLRIIVKTLTFPAYGIIKCPTFFCKSILFAKRRKICNFLLKSVDISDQTTSNSQKLLPLIGLKNCMDITKYCSVL